MRLTTVNLAETLDILMRARALSPERVRAVLEPLLVEDLTVVDIPAAVPWGAVDLRRCYDNRRSRPLSLADVACEEGIALMALPNSAASGRSCHATP